MPPTGSGAGPANIAHTDEATPSKGKAGQVFQEVANPKK